MAEPACNANTGDEGARAGTEASGAPHAQTAPAPEIGVRPDGSRVIVTVRGELDLDSAEQLEYVLGAALGASVRGVDLELDAVAFCDCSALNVLLGVREHGLKQGKTVALRTVGPAVARLLTLTGTRMLFDVPCPDADADADADGDCDGDGDGDGRVARCDVSAGAAPGGIALEDLRIEVVQLRRAMQTRPVIDLARGVLMASFGLSVEQAWRVLVLASQKTNTKLYRLAHDLVAGVLGERPAPTAREQVASAVAEVRAGIVATGPNDGIECVDD